MNQDVGMEKFLKNNWVGVLNVQRYKCNLFNIFLPPGSTFAYIIISK